MNDKYELIGGILYHTPVDDTNEQIQSEYFSQAVAIADVLLYSKLDVVKDTIKNLDPILKNYMNSPLVDFMHEHLYTYNGWMYVASNLGYLNMVRYLIEVKNVSIHNDNTALRNAASSGHFDIVKYVVERGANVNDMNDEAFRYASKGGHVNIVEYLLQRGANVGVWDNVALLDACCIGKLEIIKCLVKYGINVHLNNDLALRIAISWHRNDIVVYLKSLL